ncbi:MAG TPA: hypothetical protein VK784_14545, partial [Pseudonocardiaceae bacterium]|nr:hypothetical protein [Pseudonocardiaceae bacterium]
MSGPSMSRSPRGPRRPAWPLRGAADEAGEASFPPGYAAQVCAGRAGAMRYSYAEIRSMATLSPG